MVVKRKKTLTYLSERGHTSVDIAKDKYHFKALNNASLLPTGLPVLAVNRSFQPTTH